MHFGWKMVRSAVHKAFLNTLAMGTLFPCVPAAFRQSEWRSHSFNFEMTPPYRVVLKTKLHIHKGQFIFVTVAVSHNYSCNVATRGRAWT